MTNPLSDEDLVKGTLAGDEDAFSQLYERYRRPVYATAYRIIQSAEDAQDATQEIFIKLFRSLSGWDRDKSKFSTWLYRLAANHAIDRWRVRRRLAEEQLPGISGERSARELAIAGAIHSPFRELEGREQLEEICRCTDLLPELQKKVFVLRYFQELKLEEIAEMESCSLGTVKTSLFRASHTIRKALRKFRGLR